MRDLRAGVRTLAFGILLILERLKAMSDKTDAFAAAFDQLLAKFDEAKANAGEVTALRDELARVTAERDEANAFIEAATTKAKEKLEG
jgi:hypothetical protein